MNSPNFETAIKLRRRRAALSSVNFFWLMSKSNNSKKNGTIIGEIKRIGDRVEITFPEVTTTELPAAALAESPIYRGGEQLQPWQRSFVTLFLQHAAMSLTDYLYLGVKIKFSQVARSLHFLIESDRHFYPQLKP
jgi:hypothetical protein